MTYSGAAPASSTAAMISSPVPVDGVVVSETMMIIIIYHTPINASKYPCCFFRKLYHMATISRRLSANTTDYGITVNLSSYVKKDCVG